MESTVFDEDGEGFGQNVDLTQRIREILGSYPEGTSIIKELIQNADDATASKFKLCFDKRTLGTTSLLSPALAQYQGPSLLCYNNKKFTQQDYEAIRKVGAGAKRKDVAKTGRFGIGFNAVYHLTDLPSFVSGPYCVYFDPHMSNLPGLREPGKRFNVAQSSAKYHDQFAGFENCFGYNSQRDFDGTLFRLPLRTPMQAKLSNLSRQSYTSKSVEDLFEDFMKEAPQLLLFLRNLVSIKLYTWEPGQKSPSLIFKSKIENNSKELSAKRLHFVARSEALVSQKGVETESKLEQNPVIYRLRIAVERPATKTAMRQEWMVGQVFGGVGGKCLQMAYDSLMGTSGDGVRIPWGGVAALISSPNNPGADPAQARVEPVPGIAFCTLPLPILTQLPVHVNATFALTDNRRDLWLGDDMRGEAKRRSDWNYNLLEEVVAPAYCETILQIAKDLAEAAKDGSNLSLEDYYSIWPRWQDANRHNAWGFLTRKFYDQIGDHPAFSMEHKSGLRFRTLRPPTVLLTAEQRRVYPDLEGLLLSAGVQLTAPPKEIVDSLEKHEKTFYLLRPSLARKLTTKSHDVIAATTPQVASQFFQFCLSDLGQGANTVTVLDELNGLSIVPLLNGKLGILSIAPNSSPILVLSPEELALFGKYQESTLHTACAPLISAHLPLLSQHTNLRPFKPQELPQYLSKMLPSDWHQKLEVPLAGDINKEWVAGFWTYTQHHKVNLQNLVGWPLLPTTDGKLVTLTPTNYIICCMVNVPVHACEFFKALGVRELDATMFSSALTHPSDPIWTFVGKPQLSSFLDCTASIISSLSEEKILALFERFSADQRRKMLQFVCASPSHNKLTPQQQEALRWFPIFEVYDQHDSAHFVNLRGEVYLPPLGINPALFSARFLKITNSEEEKLTKSLGILQLHPADFLITHVFPVLAQINERVREETILLALQNMAKFNSHNPLFLDTLRNLEFVPTTPNLLKKPNQVYHPKLREQLADILHQDDFPIGTLAQKDNLAYLEKLGLQTEMTREGFLMCTQRVAELAPTDPQRAVARGRSLLGYLDAHFTRILAEKSSKVSRDYFCSEIQTIKWLPVFVMPEQEGGVPWLRPDTLVQSPVNTRPKTELELVGCAKFVLEDTVVKSRDLLQCFNWHAAPPAQIVAQHLLRLGSFFTPANPVNNITAKQNLAIIIPKVYQFLSNFVGKEGVDWASVRKSNIVWNGSYFLPPTNIAFTSPARNNKYLSTVPADLSGFSVFLQFLGVRDKYGIEDFLQALVDVAHDFSGKLLPPDMLDLAVLLDQHTAELSPYYPGFPGKFSVYLPNERGVLVTSQNLVYNDASWLDQSHLLEGADNMEFVHPRISYETATKLNVKSMRHLLVYKNAQNMELGFSSQHVQAFGQHESITNRIRNILQLYPEGTGILTELLQNADDARATNFTLYLDKNSYPSRSLMAPSMEAWQGPSLCVFNNALFTNEDFRSLSTIGQDRKLDRPGATGRFGLGFNAVYHLTDVPSIVSGPYLVYLDPHAQYVPGATSAHPGIKIDFTKSGVSSVFPDQFLPFSAFGPNMKSFFDGTFFRFPLRSEATAKDSEIKKQVVSVADVENMLMSLQKSASNTLLFLKNIRKISVFVLEPRAAEPRLAFSTEISELGNQNASRIVPEFVAGTAKAPHTKEAFYNRLASIPAHLMPNAEYVVEAVTRFFPREAPEPRVLREKFAVCSLIGGEQLLKMATDPAMRHLRLVPWTGVACLIGRQESNSEKEMKDVAINRNEGKVFCFLPLPVEAGLPVHVHACFELSSNRRDILSGEDMHGEDKLRFKWNSLLISEIIPQAYARLISFSARLFTPQISAAGNGSDSLRLFYNSWPDLAVAQTWKPLVKQLYELVLTKPVLWSGEVWVAPQNAFLVSETKGEERATIDLVLDELKRRGARIVDPPNFVRQSLIDLCGNLVQFVSGPVVRAFLRTSSTRKINVQEVSLDSSVALFKYCLIGATDNPDIVANELQSLQIVPLADSSLGIFGRNYYTATPEQAQLLPSSAKSLILHADAEKAVAPYLPFLEARANICKMNWTFSATLLRTKVSELSQEPSGSQAEWLTNLWKYINAVESPSDLTNFVGMPIVPTKDSSHKECELSLKPSGYLDMDALDDPTKEILVKFGLQQVDTSLTGTAGNRNQVVFECLPIANLQTICDCIFVMFPNCGREPVSVPLDPAQRHLLRKFLTEQQGQALTETQTSVIRSLPIFLAHPKWGQRADGADEFVTLLGSDLHLPNPAFESRSFGPNFIQAASEREATLIRAVGISDISKTRFLQEFVFPKLEEMPAEIRDDVMLRCVKNLSLLQAESPEFFKVLCDTKFVPTHSGKLFAPNQLYSVDISNNIKQFLDPELSFPAGVWVENEWALVPLGLNRQLGESGVVMCAQRIHELAHNGQGELAVSRSKLLLAYLDVNPPTYKQPDALANVDWLPVMQSIYSHFPNFVAPLSVAAPSKCRPKTDLPMVSASLFLVDHDLQSPALLKFLRFDTPISMVTLATQLISFARLYEGSFSSNDPAAFDAISAKAMHKVYEALQSVLIEAGEIVDELVVVREPTTENAETESLLPNDTTTPNTAISKNSMNPKSATNLNSTTRSLTPRSATTKTEIAASVHAMLVHQACLCLAGKLYPPSRTAFKSSIDTGNYFLACVPEEERVKFGPLFKWLGTRDEFSPNDYALLLSEIWRHNEKEGAPLSDSQMKLAVACSGGVAANMNLVDTIPYVPTLEKRMAPATDLVFNDAPWIVDPAVLSKFVQVSPDVDNDVAEKLGCQSLRKSVLSGGEKPRDTSALTCPSAATITARLGSYVLDASATPFSVAMQFLALDMLEVADALGCASVQFLHDTNSYPAQSILLPSLAPFQGPSLTILFKNCALDQEKAYLLHGLDPSALRERRLKYGWGLTSLYTISPVLFVLSQDNFFIFDPSSKHLPAPPPGAPKPTGSGRATGYKLPLITTKFPDQFKPFSIFGGDIAKNSKDTILRVPLSNIENITNVPSQLSASGLVVEAIKNEMKKGMETSMVFMPNLEAVTWTTFSPADKAPIVEYVCSLSAQESARTQRKVLMENTSWKALLGIKWFSGSPDLHLYDVTTTVFDKAKPATATSDFSERKWVVSVSYGVDGSKAHAKQHPSNNFYPMGASAAVVWSNSEVGKPGNVHCFLPTSRPSASIMHFSAAFELKRETREVYAFPKNVVENSSDNNDDSRATWNREILACVAQSMIQLLTYCNTKLKDPALLMRIWPVFSMDELPNDPFNIALGRLFYKKLGSQTLFLDQRGFQKSIKEGYFLLPDDFPSTSVAANENASVATVAPISAPIPPPVSASPVLARNAVPPVSSTPTPIPIAVSASPTSIRSAPMVEATPRTTTAAPTPATTTATTLTTTPTTTPATTATTTDTTMTTTTATTTATTTPTIATTTATSTPSITTTPTTTPAPTKKPLSKYVAMLAYESFPIFSTGREVSRDVMTFVPANEAKFVTPAAIRDAVKKLPKTHKMFSNTEFALNVLDFSLSDKPQPGKPTMRGLRLLPLASGEVVTFGDQTYIVAKSQQQALLPHLKGSFVHEGVLASPSLAAVFNSPAFQQDEKLTPLSLQVFLRQIQLPQKSAAHLKDFWSVALDLAFSMQDLVSPLGIEALLPAVGSEQDLVYVPVSFLINMIIVEDELSEHLQPIIAAFVFAGATILHKTFNDTFKPFAEKFDFSTIASSHTDQQVANTLIQSLRVNENASKMPHDLRTKLQLFLNDLIAPVPLISEENKQNLRKVPMFTSLRGTRMSAENAPHFVGGFSKAATFLKYLALPPTTILEADPVILPLARYLGVTQISDVDVLAKHVLPEFLSFKPEQQNELTEFVKQHGNAEIVTALAAVPFVTTAQGMQKIENLISPRIALAKILGPECPLFPTGKFSQEDWLSFLENRMNLRKTVNSEAFLLCAQSVVDQSVALAKSGNRGRVPGERPETHSIPVNREIFDKAFLLIEYFSVKNFATIFNPPLCKKLADMMVLPVEFPKKGNYRLSSFNKVVLPQFGYLVWKVKPVIPGGLVPPSISHQPLSLVPPTAELAVANLLHVTQDDLDFHWPFDEPIQTTFRQIFTFLQEKWNNAPVPPSVQAALSNARIVPCGPYPHRLVQPSRLYTRTEYNFEPFIFEIPREMSSVDKVLKTLGAGESPDITDIVKVLHDVLVELRGLSLNPSEITAVCKMLVHITDNADTRNFSQVRFPLVAPTTSGALQPISQCVYNDDPSLVPLLAQDQAKYSFTSSYLDAQTCEKLKIPFLSKLITARLPTNVKIVNRQSKAMLQANLTSHELAHAIHCVYFHQRDIGQSHFYSPAEIQDTLRKCDVNFAEKLNLDYSIVDQSGQSEKLQPPANFRDANYYVDYTNLQIGLTSIYLSLSGNDGSANQLAPILAKSVAQILHLPEISANSPGLDQLLACETPSQIPLLLRGLEKLIGNCGASEAVCTCDCFGHESRRGVPGGVVLDVDKELLRITPTRSFTKGEIVAFEEKPTVFKYAKILSQPLQNTSPQKGSSLSRIEIEIGNFQKRELLSSQIYAFGSNADSARAETAASPRQERASPTQSRSPPTVPHSTKEKGVSVDDYANALQELAKKAGVPLDEEKDTLIYNNMKMKSDAENLRAQVAKLQSENEKNAKRLENYTEQLTCNICCTNKKDTAVVPCGHILCGQCAAELVVNKAKCWCRAAITSSVALKGMVSDI